MRKSNWTRRDPIKNYFPLPNEIYSLGLSAGAIAVYGFLMRIENRQTYQCTASYRTIGHATGMSVNTVRKYVAELEERGLIITERTTVTTRDGRILNGCLRYTILPIQQVVEGSRPHGNPAIGEAFHPGHHIRTAQLLLQAQEDIEHLLRQGLKFFPGHGRTSLNIEYRYFLISV